jgi:NADH:ubiquinone reductase (H+-translocating)
MEQPRTPRVIVVGGGFGGLAAAKHLARKPVEVVIIDQHNFHTFQPLLYQVATAGLEPADVAYPVRTIFRRAHNVTFRHGRVTDVDVEARKLTLSDGTKLDYDYLVVASGATTMFYGVPGASEHALPLYTLADARRLRNRILGMLEAADAKPEKYDGGAPAFVVVGGGPTGVETSGALMELLDVVVRRDRLRIDPQRSRVVLLDAGDSLLSGFKTSARRYAQQTLLQRHVEVRLSNSAAEVSKSGVRLQSGESIDAAVVVWAGGVTVNGTLADKLGAARTRSGRVEVRPDLSLEGHPEVFCIGDAAAVPWGGKHDKVCPQLAPVAIQSGTHAARQILRRVEGKETKPFSYRDKGMMATIGRRAAVAQLRVGPVFHGTLGWLAWLGLHIVELAGFRNRIVVLINWAWRYFDWPSGPRLIVADAETED